MIVGPCNQKCEKSDPVSCDIFDLLGNMRKHIINKSLKKSRKHPEIFQKHLEKQTLLKQPKYILDRILAY